MSIDPGLLISLFQQIEYELDVARTAIADTESLLDQLKLHALTEPADDD